MRYSAFISYNHRDRRLAGWLHSAIESYRIPKKLRGVPTRTGPPGARLLPVFQDREELATSGDLAATVRAALVEADSLIVICSPHAAKSRWVNEEIRTFTQLGRRDRVQCLIVDGEPHAVDPDRECLPPALFEGGAGEPMAADIRPGMDRPRAAKLKLLAGLIGVGYDDLRQREASRRQRQLAIVALASTAGLIVTAGLAVFAFIARADAIRDRDFAREKTLTAERTVNFVKSLFEVSDPSEARGASVTAREILDNGAKQIDASLSEEPSVRADLGTTLGEVYLSLGLYREGDRLIRRMLDVPGVDPSVKARQFTALADSQVKQAQYRDAIGTYKRALIFAQNSDQPRADLEPRILVGLGEAHSSVDEFAEAERAVRQALKLDMAQGGSDTPDVARDLEALGLNFFYAGALDKSRALYERALGIRIQKQGSRHPRVSEDLNTIGSIAYLQQDSPAAESYYRRALATDTLVLGPNHPDLAITMGNLARIILERRGFAEAKSLLERAIAINLAQHEPTHDDLVFPFANLGLAKAGLGDRAGGEAALLKSILAARLHQHRNLGPALVDLANLRCSSGHVVEGLSLLSEANAAIPRDYEDEPWRMAWARFTRGDCLWQEGDRATGAQLMRAAAPVLRARWKRGTLYRASVDSRLARRGIT